MRHLYIFLIIIFPLVNACNPYTRTERDVYTITHKDTVYTRHVQNAPGNIDNNVIYPSSKVLKSERIIVQRDSIVEREFPDFIRFGLFESIGVITSDGDNSMSRGLFGLFPTHNAEDVFNNRDFTTTKGKKADGIFRGGIFRIGIIEHRLRWFRDAKNWTIGTYLVEGIFRHNKYESRGIVGIMPIFVKKRFFLREAIPYVAISPSLGVGLFPNQYFNLSVSLDVGSLGGLNVRTYLGVVNDVSISGSSGRERGLIPYAGFGISFLDFLNLPKETEVEWKDHEHSAWNVGFLHFAFIRSNSETIFNTGNSDIFATGYLAKLFPTKLALPFANNRFYAGTSLVSVSALGNKNIGIGILPIQVGYWHTLIEDELTFEPYLEAYYYPSSAYKLGANLNLRISNDFFISAVAGYFQLNSSNDMSVGAKDTKMFSTAFFGLSINLYNRIFFPQHLRYNK